MFQNSCESDELGHVAFIKAASFQVGDVGEPFDFRRNIGEVAKLLRSEGMYAIATN
jgi:hypothetical protein